MNVDVYDYDDEIEVEVDESKDEVDVDASGEIIVRTATDYNILHNKPSINGHLLEGDSELTDLGLRGIYYGTTVFWESQPDLVSEEGYLYIYSDYTVYKDSSGKTVVVPGVKIGDGESKLSDLKFISEASAKPVMSYIGTTTTVISDGAPINPITIDGESYTAGPGDVVIYGKMEFVWSGSRWDEFGSTGSLKKLAFKDEVRATYTPAGNISAPNFSGTKAILKVKTNPSGTVSKPTFVGDRVTIRSRGTPAGTVSTPTFTGSAKEIKMEVTPRGSVTAPGVGVTLNTGTVNSMSSAGSVPSLTARLEGENLIVDFNAGAVPTYSAVSVATSVKQVTVTAPAFTGTKTEISASYTPEGTISQPTFTGRETESTASYIPSGTVAQPTFTGSSEEINVEYTPEGTVSTPSFTGTEANIVSE